MQASSRIIVNTLVQYIRTLFNMVLSLYSSRLVLDILGVDDFGVYSLVAGVVSMLSFLTSSLVTSTQRFLSVSQGRGELARLKQVFNNSLILHILIAIFTAIILFAITPFLLNGFLNIPIERVSAAKILYWLVVLMVVISFIASPYRALLISHENILYTSIIDILDGVLKVILVLIMPYFPFDKLLIYGVIMLLIQLFNLLALSIYSHIKYEECSFPKIALLNLSFIRQISLFTGWILYSSICLTVRNQGVAIILNRIYGAAINAAYGIGSQISSMLAFVGTSFNNAIAPQLMAAEGSNDRSRMLTLAEAQSKFSFLLMAILGIPAMFEMQTILGLWLVEVPTNTMIFGCMFLSMQIIDMLSTGLASANKAIGNIQRYTVITYTPKLFVLPLAWIILKCGFPIYFIAVLMFVIETICMLLRIYAFRCEEWFNPWDFVRSVIVRSVPPVVASISCCIICDFLIPNRYLRLALTFLISIIIFMMIAYTISLNKREKLLVKSMINKFFRR